MRIVPTTLTLPVELEPVQYSSAVVEAIMFIKVLSTSKDAGKGNKINWDKAPIRTVINLTVPVKLLPLAGI